MSFKTQFEDSKIYQFSSLYRNSSLVHKFSFATEESTTDTAESKDEENQLLNTTFTYGCIFSNSGKLLAAFADGKDLVVLRTEDWKQIGKRCVILLDYPRRHFSPESKETFFK